MKYENNIKSYDAMTTDVDIIMNNMWICCAKNVSSLKEKTHFKCTYL